MARDYWYDTMLERFESTPGAGDWSARPIRDVRVSVFAPGTTTLQTIYSARTGGAAKANPFTTGDDGFADFWADSGGYDIKIEDTQAPARVATKTIGWSSVSGETGGIPASQLAGGITSALLAAVLQEAIWKPGDIKTQGGAAIPSGWLVCDGQAVSRVTYAAMYAGLGGAASPWGQGDGSTTFNVPDLRGRAMVHKGVATGDANATTRNLGSLYGSEKHALATAELAAHSHTGATGGSNESLSHSHSAGTIGSGWAIAATPGGSKALPPAPNNANTLTFQDESGLLGGNTGAASTPSHTHNFSTNNTGNGTAHNNVGPRAAVTAIVKI